jgi:recombination protein RecA
LWIAAEDFVPDWSQAGGVQLDRTIVMATNVMEEVYNTVLTAMDNRAVDGIVIDSYPALVATAEDEQAMEEFAVAAGARLTGKFLRKGTRAQKRSLVEDDRACTCWIINQWRDKIGTMFGDPRTTPGGKAKNYHYFTRTEVKRDEILWAGEKKKSPQVGISMGVSVFKNKSYRPNTTAQFDFYVSDYENMGRARFDVPLNIFEMAIAAELIEKRGAWYYFQGAQLGQGKDAAVDALRDDGATLIDIHRALFQHHLPDRDAPSLPGVVAAPAPVKRAIRRKAS